MPQLPAILPHSWDDLQELAIPILVSLQTESKELGAHLSSVASIGRRTKLSKGVAAVDTTWNELTSTAKKISRAIAALGECLADDADAETVSALLSVLARLVSETISQLEQESEWRDEDAMFDGLREAADLVDSMLIGASDLVRVRNALHEAGFDEDDKDDEDYEERGDLTDDWGVAWSAPEDAYMGLEVPPMRNFGIGRTLTVRQALREAQEACLDLGPGSPLALISAVLKIGVRNARVCYALGRVIYETGVRAKLDQTGSPQRLRNYFESASQWFKEAVERNWNIGGAHIGLARTLGVLGDNERALRAARTATELAPQHAESWDTLSIELSESGQHAESIQAKRVAVACNPGSVWLRENLVQMLRQAALPQEALKAAREAITHPSVTLQTNRFESALLYREMGRALFELGRYEEALRALREGVRRSVLFSRNAPPHPTDLPEDWGFMAGVAFAAGRHPLAVSLWERALLLEPAYFDEKPGERQRWESAIAAVGPQPAAEDPVRYPPDVLLPTGLPV